MDVWHSLFRQPLIGKLATTGKVRINLYCIRSIWLPMCVDYVIYSVFTTKSRFGVKFPFTPERGLVAIHHSADKHHTTTSFFFAIVKAVTVTNLLVDKMPVWKRQITRAIIITQTTNDIDTAKIIVFLFWLSSDESWDSVSPKVTKKWTVTLTLNWS